MGDADRDRRVQAAATVRGAPVPPLSADLANLGNFTDEGKFCSSWLSLQCSRIPGVNAALLLLKSGADGTEVVAATWPEPALDLPDLLPLAKRALVENRTVIGIGRGDAGQTPAQVVGLLIAVPFGVSGNTIGVAALAVPISNGSTALPPEVIAEQVRWGAGWLEALPLARQISAHRQATARSAASLDMLALAGEHGRLKAAAFAVVNEVAASLKCDRVALGFVRPNGRIRVYVISHSASFRRQSRLVHAMANAMEEAAEQNATIAFPGAGGTDRLNTQFHRALADEVRIANSCFATVPLTAADGRSIGALLLERHRGEPFDSGTLQLAEAMTLLLTPQFALQLEADRPISGRWLHGLGNGLEALLGPGRPSLKLGVVSAVAATLFLAFAQGEHRLTAKSVLEGEVQNAAVAPFDGFVVAAPRRAGDLVQAGELLAKLDDKDLVLDQLKWRAELDKLVQKHREALAKHDRTPLTLLGHQIKQAESQLALANEKLARTRIEASISGLVVSGDLSQMLGSPVERGKVLFEVTPLDDFRLNIFLDERDIRFVTIGQRGSVAFAGSPTERLPFEITKVTPVAVPEDGRNSFRVEAQLEKTGIPLRPGLEGVAKIDAGRRSLFWIWTHSTFDWLRLMTWKYAY